jgi:hypothetical protein
MATDLKTITKNAPKKPIVVLHGPEGIGKTTFAAMAPDPVFLLTEDGLGDLVVPRYPEKEKGTVKSFKEIMEFISDLYIQDHEFKTLVVDSLDKLEPLVWKAACDRTGYPTIETINGGYGKGYVEACTEWQEFMDGISALRNKKDMYVILIAHSTIVPIKDPTQPDYDKYILNLNKRAVAICTDLPDVVGFASWETFTNKEKGEDRYRAVTTGKRILYLSPKPYHSAKNRYHMQEEIPLLWSEFAKGLPGGA